MEMLQRHFGKVEKVILANNWHYTDADELIERLKTSFPDQEKFIGKYEDKLKKHFAGCIEKEGEISIEIESAFWHCR